MHIFRSRTFLIIIGLSSMSSSENSFPDTLEGFGYAFDKDGKLKKIDPKTGEAGKEPFEFKVKDDHTYNQRRYEALGDVITKYVYGLLENELGLKTLMVPKDGNPEQSTFVFASPDIYTNKERLLILMHGSGVVRAGQWARSKIINHSLESGTQIPYIKRARELGYSVLVLNTNDNYRIINGEMIEIKGSEEPEKHANYVWKNYVKEINPKHIAIVAHSYGGCVTLDLAARHFSDFRKSVFAIAFTDSVHDLRYQKVPFKVMEYFHKVARNWAADTSPLDTPLKTPIPQDVPKVSAGETVHELTSWRSFESIFKFIEEKYAKLAGKQEL